MDSLQGEFEAAWTQFQLLEDLRLVSDTLESEWTRGRDAYLAFLVPVDDTQAVDYLRATVRRIEQVPGVEPYPEGYWHITIKGIGFEAESAERPDDVGRQDLDSIKESAARVFKAQAAFDVTVGQANAFPEVVFAEVQNSLPVRDLNIRLLEAAPELIRYPFDGEVFLPHVSIARFTSAEGLDELKETLHSLRNGEPHPTLRIGEVDLVRAHLSAGAPQLETIHTYRLQSR
jgi:2'-5' RNA ligase